MCPQGCGQWCTYSGSYQSHGEPRRSYWLLASDWPSLCCYGHLLWPVLSLLNPFLSPSLFPSFLHAFLCSFLPFHLCLPFKKINCLKMQILLLSWSHTYPHNSNGGHSHEETTYYRINCSFHFSPIPFVNLHLKKNQRKWLSSVCAAKSSMKETL